MKRIMMFLLALSMVAGVGVGSTAAQFTIKLPKLPKMEKVKQETPVINDSSSPGQTNSSRSVAAPNQDTSGKPPNLKPAIPDMPLFLKETLEIKVKIDDKYWKLPNQRYYSNWIPQVQFEVFVNENARLGYKADWLKPDGSLWYSESLEVRSGNDSTQIVRSEYNGKLFDTTSTDQAGKFGIKITNSKTNEVIFHGRFNVKKSPTTPGDPQMKNAFQFFVDNDWHLAVGYAGYGERYWLEGRIHPTLELWFKGVPKPEDLEARLFYNNEQLTSTANGGRIYNKKTHGDGCARGQEVCSYGLFSFQWNNFVVDKEYISSHNYPNAFSSKDRPGEYTVKVFHKGVQVREAKFTMARNGTVVRNDLSGSIYPTLIMIPVKVMDTTEKWNPIAWKTDMFYGNLITGFSVQ